MTPDQRDRQITGMRVMQVQEILRLLRRQTQPWRTAKLQELALTPGRDHLIAQAKEAGATLRDIAEAVGHHADPCKACDGWEAIVGCARCNGTGHEPGTEVSLIGHEGIRYILKRDNPKEPRA